MSRWPCFLVRPTDRAFESLRRYGRSGCPLNRGDYHNAEVIVGEVEFRSEYNGDGDSTSAVFKRFARDDERWPRQCACGYVFGQGDEWQANRSRICAGERAGQLVRGTMNRLPPLSLPPGAMWYVEPDSDMARFCRKRPPGPDGKYLWVQLPGGCQWNIDGPSRSDGVEGPGWTRTGTPPLVTVTPSIHFPGTYHGFVQNGFVTEDCDGRRFDDMGRPVA